MIGNANIDTYRDDTSLAMYSGKSLLSQKIGFDECAAKRQLAERLVLTILVDDAFTADP